MDFVRGGILQLVEITRHSYSTVSSALKNPPKSDLQRAIRAKAYELGLVVEEKNL